jgi:hypothetical protein
MHLFKTHPPVTRHSQAALAAALAAVATERILSAGDAAEVLLPHVLAAITRPQPDEVTHLRRVPKRVPGVVLTATSSAPRRCTWSCGSLWAASRRPHALLCRMRGPAAARTRRPHPGCAPPQLMDAWVRALVALAPQLERGVIERHVVPLALSKAQAHETSVQARSLGAPRPCSHNPGTQHATSMKGYCMCTQGRRACARWPCSVSRRSGSAAAALARRPHRADAGL